MDLMIFRTEIQQFFLLLLFFSKPGFKEKDFKNPQLLTSVCFNDFPCQDTNSQISVLLN